MSQTEIPHQRHQRADARANHEKLVAAARALFAEKGTSAPLEEVAERAGLGIGTLYRHFPTRDALVEAVYRNELERLRGAADELLASREPAAALRTWMDRFAEYVATKRGMADALRAVVASGSITRSETKDTLTAAIALLLDAGAAAGTVRGDVDAGDVLASLTGIFLASGAPHQDEQAERMLDLLMDGLRWRTT
jgi:AcrR family transcriptional regulator